MGNGNVAQKKEHETPEERAEREWLETLRRGGQRARITGTAEIYQRRGSQLERVTQMGAKARARPIMSNRIALSDHLRAVGNAYGGWLEECRLGLSGDSLKEVVDGGQVMSGGISVAQLESRQRVRIARRAMADLPALRHDARQRYDEAGNTLVGAHEPIARASLVDAICAYGSDITEVALKTGWFVIRDGKPHVPKNQAEKLKTALFEALEAISLAWEEAGIDTFSLSDGVEIS